ncbi:MAG: TlpA family protein disulfide reductase [Tenacibaculum sp.]
MKTIIFKTLGLLIFIFLVFGCASGKDFSASKDKQGNLIGKLSRKHLEQEPYASDWFNDFYSYYKLDSSVVTQLKKYLKQVKIIGFMGTWCSDSMREIPTFYKLLDQADFNFKNLEIFGLDRNKKGKGLEKGYNIIRVPTLIFYKNGREIGRFVEHPLNDSTIEADILKIVSGKPYKHPYE